jgi:hypothetical protein
MREWIGKAFKGTARVQLLKTINTLAAQSRYTLVPCDKSFAGRYPQSGVAYQRLLAPEARCRNRITDRFGEFDLCFDGNTKPGGDELSET